MTLETHRDVELGVVSFRQSGIVADGVQQLLEITEGITCVCGLIAVEITDVIVVVGDRDLSEAETWVVDMLLGEGSDNDDLARLVHLHAIAKRAASRSGSLWTLLLADTSLYLIDRLKLRNLGGETGVYETWHRALGESLGIIEALNPSVLEIGGPRLRSHLVPMLRRWQTDAPTALLGQRIQQLIETWPTSVDDRGEPGDDTVSQIEQIAATMPSFRGGHRGRPWETGVMRGHPRSSGPQAPIDFDMSDLYKDELVHPDQVVRAERASDGITWTIDIPVRSAVASRFKDLINAWNDAIAKRSESELAGSESNAAAFQLAYARLLGECRLPERLGVLEKRIRSKHPTEPALPEIRVRCVGEDALDVTVHVSARRSGDDVSYQTCLPLGPSGPTSVIGAVRRGHESPTSIADQVVEAEAASVMDARTGSRQLFELAQIIADTGLKADATRLFWMSADLYENAPPSPGRPPAQAKAGGIAREADPDERLRSDSRGPAGIDAQALFEALRVTRDAVRKNLRNATKFEPALVHGLEQLYRML